MPDAAGIGTPLFCGARPMASPAPDITRILNRAATAPAGETMGLLLPVLYDELRRLARARLAQERPGQTLEPTALVHEAYLRLMGGTRREWDGRGHFFAAAAEAMRRILVERARGHASGKRGGGRGRVDLDTALGAGGPAARGPEYEDDAVLALDRALSELEAHDPRM